MPMLVSAILEDKELVEKRRRPKFEMGREFKIKP
jgi:hypothetical protein